MEFFPNTADVAAIEERVVCPIRGEDFQFINQPAPAIVLWKIKYAAAGIHRAEQRELSRIWPWPVGPHRFPVRFAQLPLQVIAVGLGQGFRLWKNALPGPQRKIDPRLIGLSEKTFGLLSPVIPAQALMEANLDHPDTRRPCVKQRKKCDLLAFLLELDRHLIGNRAPV